MTDMGNPVSILADEYLELFGYMVNQGGKEVDILYKYVCILHPNNARALELSVLQIQMEFTAALVLALVGPIHRLTSLTIKRDGDHRTLRQWLRSQTINDVGNLLLHTLAIITLSTASLVELPLLAFLLGVVPAHIFLCVVLQGAAREQFGLYQRRFGGDIFDDTDEIAHDEFTAWLGDLASACMHNIMEGKEMAAKRLMYEVHLSMSTKGRQKNSIL